MFINYQLPTLKYILQLDFKILIRVLALGDMNLRLIDFAKFVTRQKSNNFSSDFQDLLVLYLINLHRISFSEVFYLDIGAFDGKTKSNTKLLHNMGAKGICVEPNPEMKYSLLENQPNAQIISIALVPDDGYENYNYLNLVGDRGIASRVINKNFENSTVKIDVLIAKNFLDIYHLNKKNSKFKYLSIDIEGLDVYILQSFLENNYNPEVISIEHNHNKNIQKLILDLTSKFEYISLFKNFFRNDFILVKKSYWDKELFE